MGATFIVEPERRVPVIAETDVLIVGGGAAGIAAAVAAARQGARAMLVERYGSLGGLATNGLIILLLTLDDGRGRQVVAGLCQEMVDRLTARGACIAPPPDEWGSPDPALVERLGLSLTQAGILGGVFVVSSSVMQPAYGFLSDRYHTKLFAALAPAVAGIGISALGLAPSYAWLLALVILAGAGVAAFHPQASSAVAALSAERRGGWMAAFISSGTLGLSLGPACFSAIAAHRGLPGIYWAAAPGIAVTLLLLARLPAPGGYSRRRGFDWEPLGRVWKPLAILYLLVFLRSVVQITFAQFLPLYLTRERGFDFSTASYALTLYLASGALGGAYACRSPRSRLRPRARARRMCAGRPRAECPGPARRAGPRGP
ncbi:MAG: MFS transporter [Dehalococcoidia bacterium]|nr:MFS transporter [Dehalococcoidia bacterium]